MSEETQNVQTENDEEMVFLEVRDEEVLQPVVETTVHEQDVEDMVELDLDEGIAPVAENLKDPIPVSPGIINTVDDEIELDDSPETHDVESIEIIKFISNMNVTLNNQMDTILENGGIVKDYVSSIPANIKEINEILEKYEIDLSSDGDRGIAKRPEHVQRLRSFINESLGVHSMRHFTELFSREGSDWRQGIQIDSNTLVRQGRVAPSSKADPSIAIATKLGMGNVIQVPLWHSGIWVAFTRPEESDIINLEAEIAMEKVTVGRTSAGAIFSNNEVFAKRAIVNFALRHVIRTTAESNDPDFLSSIILETDWPILTWGILTAIYPNGFRHLQPCVANPETCNHVIDSILNVSRMLFLDNSRLTQSQKAHMMERKQTVSIDNIREYQNQHRLSIDSKIKLTDTLELELRVPDIATAISRGDAWVAHVNELSRRVFKSTMSEVEKESVRSSHAMAMSIRQYSQWFSGVRDLDTGVVHNNQDVIEQVLKTINAKGDFSRMVHNRIKKYIDDVTIATFGLVKWKCPKCGGEPSEEYLRHPEIIPVDVIDVFFTLLGRYVSHRRQEEYSNVTL